MTDTEPTEPAPPQAVVPTGSSWPRRFLSVFWNRQERRIRALWRLLALIFVMGAAGAAFYAAELVPRQGTPEYFVTVAVFNFVVGMGTVWLVGWGLDRRRFRDFGFAFDRRWWEDLSFGLALGALLMSAVFLTQWALGWIKVTGMLRTMSPNQPFAVAILLPVLLFVLVGIGEETVARGYLLRNIAEGLASRCLGGAKGGLILGCVISSALFAFGHLGNPHTTWVSTANIAVSGLLLALGLMLTGELAISIGLHVTWNFFQASVFGFAVSGVSALRTTVIATEPTGPELWTGGAFGPEAGLVGLAATILGALLVVAWVRWRHGHLRLVTRLTTPRSTGPR